MPPVPPPPRFLCLGMRELSFYVTLSEHTTNVYTLYAPLCTTQTKHTTLTHACIYTTWISMASSMALLLLVVSWRNQLIIKPLVAQLVCKFNGLHKSTMM